MSGNWFAKWILPGFAIGMLVFGVYHSLHSQTVFAIPDTVPPAAPARSPYSESIAGYGIVEPQTENISIGAALSGVVLEVYVPALEVGKKVSKGDPLFKVDDRHLHAQQAQLQAALKVAEAQLQRLAALPRTEELPASEAKVRLAEANLRLWRDQAERSQKLIGSRVITDEEHMQRQLKLEASQQDLARAQAEDALLRAGSWEEDLQVARANVAAARAQIAQVETEIQRALVCSPIDGHVLQVNIRPGEYVSAAANQALLVLGDVDALHVRVDIDEHDVPRYQRGAAAKALIRGDAGREIAMNFVRVEPVIIPKRWLSGDNTERVDTRVLQVIYAIKAAPAAIPQLYVGQLLDVYIKTTPGSAKTDNPHVSAPSDHPAADPISPQ
ncbi:MAG: HlyD family secretion protein [Planctomycetota bacterium]